ncbi:MAG TPA: hypothetical protein VMD59_12525 [Acidimicrobiales bacterium]|nr:hypothetical protein [Acidimicrobiales bacterium]
MLGASGVPGAARCQLFLRTTNDGGASWSARLPVAMTTSCDIGGALDALAVTISGSWLLATPQASYRSRIDSKAVVPVRVSTAGSSTSRRLCALAAAGDTLWATLATRCSLSDAGILVTSPNGGASWRAVEVPLARLEDSNAITAAPDSLGAAEPAALALAGRVSKAAPSNAPAPIAVASSSDAGTSWRTSVLSCGSWDRITALVSIEGEPVSAVCLGVPRAGAEPIEVVSSTNGGRSFIERCNNGTPDPLARRVGSCPPGGYPVALVTSPTACSCSASIAPGLWRRPLTAGGTGESSAASAPRRSP